MSRSVLGEPRGEIPLGYSTQQDKRPGVGEIQCPFQAGKDASELGSQSVDRAGAVGDQVQAAAGEDLEVGDGAVAGP